VNRNRPVDGRAVGRCEQCRKHAYPSRKHARTAARRRFPGERLQAYPCPHIDGLWHWGHPAPEVIAGEVSKALWYGPTGVGRVREMQGTRRPTKKEVAA
jgi:predicted RNA-binding Zn-ribbon protein involved in translation (DUF1610 family)